MNPLRLLVIVSTLLAAGCAATETTEPAEIADVEPAESVPAADTESDPLLDRTQRTVYTVVNSTSQWFDSFFGATDVDPENVTRGRLTLGTFWDERDGTRVRARLRARFPLPALEERGRLILGRGDVDNFVDGTEAGDVDTLPERFDDFEEDDWLLGVGYNPSGNESRGWDLGFGIRLRTPLEPYVRATYRWNRSFGESWFWRVHPRVFVQSQRGAGASVTNILDYAASDQWLWRSWSIINVEEEIEGMGWTQRFFAYQNISSKSAVSYSIFATGETDNEVPVQNYGLELRFRRRVARDWFHIIFSTKVDWPREFLIEERKSNFGVGLEFEMQFGDWPGRKQSLSP